MPIPFRRSTGLKMAITLILALSPPLHVIIQTSSHLYTRTRASPRMGTPLHPRHNGGSVPFPPTFVAFLTHFLSLCYIYASPHIRGCMCVSLRGTIPTVLYHVTCMCTYVMCMYMCMYVMCILSLAEGFIKIQY